MPGLALLNVPSAFLASEGGGGMHFPPIDHIVKWPAWFGEGTFYEFNKITFISFIAMLVPVILFLIAGSKAKLVPTGLQNVMETSLDFVEDQVVMPAIGPEGKRYLPMLVSMFFFIWIGNLFEVIPTAHMPANARMANPLVLAVVAWVMFIGVGVKHNGLRYFKDALFPPGVPKALYILVTPIELLSTFIIRPFSLAVRLFANMLAGHILLVTFGVLTAALIGTGVLATVVGVLPLVALIFFTLFEVLVAFLQAYIFTILTAVYIGGSAHPEH